MILDNRKREVVIRARALLRAIASLIIVAIVLTAPVFDNDLLGLTKTHWNLLILLVYLLLTGYHYYMDYYYVFIQIKKNNLIVRYYSLRPFGSKKTFLIPIAELVKADIKKKGTWGKKYLVLYRQTKDGIITYPSIGLSALNEPQMGLLRLILKKVFHLNKTTQ